MGAAVNTPFIDAEQRISSDGTVLVFMTESVVGRGRYRSVGEREIRPQLRCGVADREPLERGPRQPSVLPARNQRLLLLVRADGRVRHLPLDVPRQQNVFECDPRQRGLSADEQTTSRRRLAGRPGDVLPFGPSGWRRRLRYLGRDTLHDERSVRHTGERDRAEFPAHRHANLDFTRYVPVSTSRAIAMARRISSSPHSSSDASSRCK
jgi:hypothetical protein